MTPRVPWLVLLLSLPFAALAAEDGTAVFELAKASPQVQAEVVGYREDLQGIGYRFNEDHGTILDPKTKEPLTVADVSALLADIQAGQKFQSLQSIKGASGAVALSPRSDTTWNGLPAYEFTARRHLLNPHGPALDLVEKTILIPCGDGLVCATVSAPPGESADADRVLEAFLKGLSLGRPAR